MPEITQKVLIKKTPATTKWIVAWIKGIRKNGKSERYYSVICNYIISLAMLNNRIDRNGKSAKKYNDRHFLLDMLRKLTN